MAARSDLVSHSGQRIVFIAGRRRAESSRRANIPFDERRGSIIWVSPMAMWTKLDLNTYRSMHPDLPGPCDASALIHMSGECLCGAFAHRGELDEVGMFFPDVKAEIEQLERDVVAAGTPEPFCRWGHGEGAPTARVGALCSSCVFRGQTDIFGGVAE